MRIAVLGCGNMGQALIRGMLGKYGGTVECFCYDKRPEALTGLSKLVMIKSPELWFQKDASPDAVILAVKPQDIAEACAPFKHVEKRTLWISIAAGISIETLKNQLPDNSRICRVMPNTPSLIGEGMAAYSLNDACVAEDAKLVESILGACGAYVKVPEKMMDAVTGLSGSGPAYVYLFIEALIEGGVASGLPGDIARDCAIQTVIGAARMVQTTGETPAMLKSKVMSPGGTTVQGLLVLEKQGFKYSVIDAVKAAAERSAELGKKEKK
jgi:pyrroline-5-carboxylate reductase